MNILINCFKYKILMLTLHSPQNTVNQTNSSSKIDLLSNNISPTYRNKRTSSAQDKYSFASNQNLKITKIDSPSNFS